MSYPRYPDYDPQRIPIAPRVYPVVLWTLFVGIFGAIPASISANKARLMGLPTSSYWVAFWVTLVIQATLWFCWFVVFVSLMSTPTTN